MATISDKDILDWLQRQSMFNRTYINLEINVDSTDGDLRSAIVKQITLDKANANY